VGVILNWSTGYTGTPASVDDTTANFPTLSNGTHDVLDSHVNQLALAVIQIETIQSALSPLVVKDEGSILTSGATSLNYTGAGVTATTSSGDVTVNITGNALGAASGDLVGTYPAPTVVKIAGRPLGILNPSAGQPLTWDGGTGTWNPLSDLTLATITISGTVDGRDVSVDGAALDSHIANVVNPHSTDLGNLGTGTLAELNALITDATLSDKTTIVLDATTARTLADSDNGSMIIFTDVAAKTVTVPDTLSVGITVVLVNSEVGADITVQSSGTMSLVAKPSATVPLVTAEKWDAVAVTVTTATTALVYGGLG
jgi:hypothetical protein